MEKKIIFLDVDGTLTLPDGKISSRVQEAIKQARANGHKVFICTGRSLAGTQVLLKTGLFDGVISSAGGYIQIGDDTIFDSCLSAKDVQLARDVFERHHILYNLEANDMTFQDEKMNYEFIKHRLSQKNMNSELQRLLNEQKEHFHIRPIEEYDRHRQPIQKICFMCYDEQELEEPRKVLSDKFRFIIHEIFSQDVINGEIIIKGTDKGEAVKKVCERLGYSLEQTIGFGDSMNDYEMIHVCHYGVVMGNGSKELKQCAQKVCESVEEDGIYHEFCRLGLCQPITCQQENS